MAIGLGLRTLGQAMVFLIIARVLGVEEYGAYSAVLALALAVSWFVGMGASGIMLRNTSRDPDALADSWGHTLAAWMITAPILFTLYLMTAHLVLPPQVGWTVIGCIGVADLLLGPLHHAAMQAYQSHERMGRAGLLLIAPVLPRMAMSLLLLILAFTSPPLANLVTWSWGYLLAAIASTLYILGLMRNDFNLTHSIQWRNAFLIMREGWPYALGSASGKLYVDIDKLMLARISGLDVAGVYAAAYRVIDMASIPLAALLNASAPRVFRAGQKGIVASGRYVLKILPAPLLYAGAVGAAFFLLAGALPWLLGAQYENAVNALRWLAWLPLIGLPRSFMQHTLIGADKQMQYAFILTIGAMSNIGLNLMAIPAWGWRGAVGATYATELIMFCIQSAVYFHQRKRQTAA